MTWNFERGRAMKRFLTLAIATASIGFIAAGTASATTVSNYTAGSAATGIAQSRHNLGAFGAHLTSNGTTEICVFCHTPHHTSSTGAGPLWNRGASVTAFTAYTSTIAGTTPGAPGAGSLACLSCHDGTTTLDNIANKPGKAGLGSAGIGSSSDAGWYFFEDGMIEDDTLEMMDDSRLAIGMDADLSNDHPIGVTYYGGTKASLRQTSLTIAGISVSADLASSASSYDSNNLTQNRWAVNGFVSSTASIADLLRDNKVECTSCHDPHFSNKSWTEIDATYSTDPMEQEMMSDGMFLRRVGGNAGSGVCRTCHEK